MDLFFFVSCVLLSFIVVIEEQLFSFVCFFKIKLCVLDLVLVYVLKECLLVLFLVMMKIVNLFIEFVLVLDCFKLVFLNFFFKKLCFDFENYVNFRFIFNLIFIFKLIEKVVVFQFVDYVMCNDLDEIFQFVYKQFYSIEIVLVRVNNDIFVVLDNYQFVILFFLDLLVVFDIVDYGILFDWLSYCFGICGQVFFWFKLYFSNRFQFVEIRGEKFLYQLLMCGVLQGFVLGFIFYLLYILLFGDIVRRYNMGFYFYVDDIQLYLFFDFFSGEG